MIFVFGSNRQGRHGKGAALTAVQKYGAIYGQAKGRQGDSYAIVTKELRNGYQPVTLEEVQSQIRKFLQYAEENEDQTFLVTKVGCGLAGFDEVDIKKEFVRAPSNCILPDGWRKADGSSEKAG